MEVGVIAANLACDSFDIASDMAEDLRVRVIRKRMMNPAMMMAATMMKSRFVSPSSKGDKSLTTVSTAFSSNKTIDGGNVCYRQDTYLGK